MFLNLSTARSNARRYMAKSRSANKTWLHDSSGFNISGALVARPRVGNGYRVLIIPDEYLVIPGYWKRVRVLISEVFVRYGYSRGNTRVLWIPGKGIEVRVLKWIFEKYLLSLVKKYFTALASNSPQNGSSRLFHRRISCNIFSTIVYMWRSVDCKWPTGIAITRIPVFAFVSRRVSCAKSVIRLIFYAIVADTIIIGQYWNWSYYFNILEIFEHKLIWAISKKNAQKWQIWSDVCQT